MQVNCGIGREQVESWGRKKRSIGAAEQRAGTGKPLGDDMTLSREIVVLDLKDKADGSGSDYASSRDDLSSTSDSFVQKAPLKSSGSPLEQGADSESPSQSPRPNPYCFSSQSLLWLICSIGLVFVAYVCLVAYFFSRRDTKISVIKHQYH